jgi:tRNA(Arg) A34 adenosine deaminase TadA
MLPASVQLALPSWVASIVDSRRSFEHDDAKMALAVELSQRNVEAGTGGPFGAVLFDCDHRVVAAGVNCVVPLSCSVAHAEMMALMLAQQKAGRPRLNRTRENQPAGPYSLAASSQPCCQCYGALIWAGIDRLVIGARSEDVTSLTTFDEGPLPADWMGELERRGIEVRRDVRRDEACAVLRAYGAGGGSSY